MVECDWAILCDYAFLDVGRKTCMIGTFSRIFAGAVPATHPQVAIVLRLTGEPGETAKLRIEIVRPIAAGGGTIGGMQNDMKLDEQGAIEFTTQIIGLPLPDWGVYAFNVYADEKPLKTVTFSVAQVPKQATGGGAEGPPQG